MIKVFKVAHLRDLERQVFKGEISYSRMVEILNEMANDAFSQVSNIGSEVGVSSNDIQNVMSTLKVCATGCNGIVINGTCNNCGAKW